VEPIHAAPLGLEILASRVDRPHNGYTPVSLATPRGDVECRYYPVDGSVRAAVWVGGAGGGWDSPGRGRLPLGPGLYPKWCEELRRQGIASLRVRYRRPADLNESVLDALTGLDYLCQRGIIDAAIAGWSFGGAVAIQAAAATPLVRMVVTLATQSAGTEIVGQLGPRCSILLIHGTADRTLLPANSQFVYALAHDPRRLVLCEGTDHALNQTADQVFTLVRDWIVERLG
jgi:alpha/beta superfamily hydrolase